MILSYIGGIITVTIGFLIFAYIEKQSKSELLCKKQLNPIEEKELNTAHNSTFM